MGHQYIITSSYCYHDNRIVDMFFINGIPFTFDDITRMQKDDPYIQVEADGNQTYTMEDMYKASVYLVMEECHPLIFELDLKNPEELPKN